MPLLQNEDIGDTFIGMFKHLKVRITTVCNMHCAHCYVPSERYNLEPEYFQNYEWIERCAKNKHIESIHLQGGEPTMNLEGCIEASKVLKKIGKPFSVFSNGQKLMDPEFRKRFDEEVCPDILIVSFNKYLEAQTDQANVVNTLAEHYMNHPTIKFGTTAFIDKDNVIASELFIKSRGWLDYDKALFPEINSKLKYDYWKFPLMLCPAGRAEKSEAAGDVYRLKWPMMRCDFSITICPGGLLRADCGCGSSKKTLLGHIDDFGDDPVEEVYKRMNRTIYQTKELFSGPYEYCLTNPEMTCLTSYPTRTKPDDVYITKEEVDA